jgi:transposase
MHKSNLIGVDLAKSVFQLAIADHQFHITGTKRLSRSQFYQYFFKHTPITVVMETCGTAHYWARTLGEMGHQVILLPAQYVKPYVRRNKNDRNDACALIEAVRNREIRPVPVKTEYQQAIQALHRLRHQYVRTRTSRINTLRAMLREFGVVVPMGPKAAIQTTTEAIDTLHELMRPSVIAVLEELRQLQLRITELEKQLKQVAKDDIVIQRFLQINGVGLLSATAMRAAVQSPDQFKNGRQLAAWLGLTPREYSSGNQRYLGRISKRGDKYLRMLLVHGARSVLARIKSPKRDQNEPISRLQQWALQLEQRVGHNKAAVALANKMARIMWASWMHERDFSGNYQAA